MKQLSEKEQRLVDRLNQRVEELSIPIHRPKSTTPEEEVEELVSRQPKPCYPSDHECDCCTDVNCILNPEYEDAELSEEDECYADCESCPVETCPAKIYDTDYPEEVLNDEMEPQSAYDKLPSKDKKEIKDSLEKSKRVATAIKYDDVKDTYDIESVFDNNTNTWDKFLSTRGFNSSIVDTELITKWRKYKKQVEDWISKHSKFPANIAKAFLLDEYDEQTKSTEKLPWNEKVFKSIVDKMFDTYQKKNADYGDSFAKLFDKYGMTSVLIRLQDKLNRLESLNNPGKDNKVKDESVEDTLLDLANYAILTIIELRKQTSEPNNSK